MARMNARTKESLAGLRRYLEVSLVTTRKIGNRGAGLKRWIAVLDDILGTHSKEEKA